MSITSIGGSKMIGSIQVRNTYENIRTHTRSPDRVAVEVDIRGYYTVEQIDDLMEMLVQAKTHAEQERIKMQHDSLFDTFNAGDSRHEPE